MCGIFALIGYNHPFDESYFHRGKKRGPEFSILKQYVNGIRTNYFGFHRLAINGLTPNGNQPLEYKNYVLICNGEIYNYKELIRDYNLNVTRGSDCEVILHLYHLFGSKCLNKLDGEFSFVIYDKTANFFFIARDPYGVRPLYMNVIGNTFCFSSDIAPMQFMNTNNLEHFEPGTYMEISGGINYYISKQEDYIHYYKPLIKTEHQEYLYNIYALLCKAVVKRVENTERPVACLLSGGLDSSLVAAIAARHLSQKGMSLETYSIGLEGSEDLKYAAKVAHHIKSKHTQIICTEDDFINSIPDVIKDIESYDTTSIRASVGNWNVGKYIKEHSEARVVLNGDGADELMGGYLYFHACPNSNEFANECSRLLKNIHQFDVLRSDKSIASHGLEPRTPFLDIDFTSYYLRIPPNIRSHIGQTDKRVEKYLIREAFGYIAPELLPPEILYRKKEAFSDGVSSLNHSWYQIIQEKLNDIVIPNENYSVNPDTTPTTKEQKYYRHLFETYYPGCSHIIPYFWMPRFVNATDASARTLNIYQDK
jgi:asparagine synthase (glutamine-hydrolysing)